MKINWKKTVGIIALIAIVLVVVIRLISNKNTTESKVYNYDKSQTIQVGTLLIEESNLDDVLKYSGTFEPNRETKISAETQGKINRILVDEGDYVSQGQTLVQLDNSLLRIKVQAADAQIKALEVDVNRFTTLANADAIQGVQLEKVQLGLTSARIEKSALLEQIDKTTIRAPFSGIITAKFTEIGAFAAPGMPLLQITDIQKLKFTIQVSDEELPFFTLGETYQIKPDAYSEILLTGNINMIGSKANMGSSFPIQFLLSNTKKLDVKSGMFGTVKRLGDSKDPVKQISIPTSAIVGADNQAQVYLVKNGKASLHRVTVSKRIGNNTIITDGLKNNDVIVTRGLINLFDGANVSTQK
jgi:RND family efflux transporter MFP subunit